MAKKTGKTKKYFFINTSIHGIKKKIGFYIKLFVWVLICLFILFETFAGSKYTKNYPILRNTNIIFLISYSIIFFIYAREVFLKKVDIKHYFFIYGQIFYLFSIFVGILIYGSYYLDIFGSLPRKSIIENIIMVILFPGYYFVPYFECIEQGWNCIGQDLGIALLFNGIIFITLGFVLGWILNTFRKKK